MLNIMHFSKAESSEAIEEKVARVKTHCFLDLAMDNVIISRENGSYWA